MQSYTSIDEYIANFTGEPKKRLEIIRVFISNLLPTDATEKISYGIPTVYLNGNLIHYAAYEKHIGLYPGSEPIKQLKNELAGFKTSKGAIQLPYDKPLPMELISTVISLCLERNFSKK